MVAEKKSAKSVSSPLWNSDSLGLVRKARDRFPNRAATQPSRGYAI